MLTCGYKKSVGDSLVTRPTLRGSGIAQQSRTSNAEAHADMYIYNYYRQLSPAIEHVEDIRYPNGRQPLLCFLTVSETARFLSVKHKASSNAFLIYKSHPLSHLLWVRRECHKIIYFYLLTQKNPFSEFTKKGF